MIDRTLIDSLKASFPPTGEVQRRKPILKGKALESVGQESLLRDAGEIKL